MREDDTVLGEAVKIPVNGDAALFDLIHGADVKQGNMVVAGHLGIRPVRSFFRPTFVTSPTVLRTIGQANASAMASVDGAASRSREATPALRRRCHEVRR